jgi:hypothetical protein
MSPASPSKYIWVKSPIPKLKILRYKLSFPHCVLNFHNVVFQIRIKVRILVIRHFRWWTSSLSLHQHSVIYMRRPPFHFLPLLYFATFFLNDMTIAQEHLPLFPFSFLICAYNGCRLLKSLLSLSSNCLLHLSVHQCSL